MASTKAAKPSRITLADTISHRTSGLLRELDQLHDHTIGLLEDVQFFSNVGMKQVREKFLNDPRLNNISKTVYSLQIALNALRSTLQP